MLKNDVESGNGLSRHRSEVRCPRSPKIMCSSSNFQTCKQMLSMGTKITPEVIVPMFISPMRKMQKHQLQWKMIRS
ncbi:hypothetical protein A0H81_09438 [Grifola frondosa]|uniref:Uncharacterized protein n=1 Tax=Grifola frondosa TaxID=5627 RepID=A0A1C7M220_GRIFR|nr:hypothetical protein A0H81_09438 [Grifola frondosa]